MSIRCNQASAKWEQQRVARIIKERDELDSLRTTKPLLEAHLVTLKNSPNNFHKKLIKAALEFDEKYPCYPSGNMIDELKRQIDEVNRVKTMSWADMSDEDDERETLKTEIAELKNEIMGLL